MSKGCFRLAIRLQCKVIPSSRRIMMHLLRLVGTDLATNYMHPLRYRVFKGRPHGCADECRAGRPCFAILFVLLEGKTSPKEPSVWESTAVRSMLRHPPPKRAGSVLLVYELFTAMIEFGPSRCAGPIVTVTHLSMERMLRRAGRADRKPTQKPAAWPHINGSNETVDAVRLWRVHEPAM